MLEVLLTGVGGQGTVLAAKVLAQAALRKGWQVRTAETIGMAQRGGSVVSHVRMGTQGEAVHGPLVAKGSADAIIAFEPAEAVRVLPYLAPDGRVVTACTAIQPVSAALSKHPYRAQDALDCLRARLGEDGSVDAPCPAAAACSVGASASDGATRLGDHGRSARSSRLAVVDDKALCQQLGTRKALNMVLLGRAASIGALPFTAEELVGAMAQLVKPQFVALNEQAIALGMA